MKRFITFILILCLTSTTWANPGHGSPFSYCEYNASPQREHRPSNIVKAEEALEAAEKQLERLEERYDDADNCSECAELVDIVLRATVGEENVNEYISYLEGSFQCYSAVYSAVNYYNYYARSMGWEEIPSSNPLNDFKPKRMIAKDQGGGEIDDDGDRDSVVGTPRPAEPRRRNKDDELGGGGGSVYEPEVPRPSQPAPTNRDCVYKGPDSTIDERVCDLAASKGAIQRRYVRECKSCLGARNKYGKCLKRLAQLEQAIIEAEELVIQREDELAEAEANPSSSTTCVDCQSDNRSVWERWGPTALTAGVVGLTGYLAYRQEKKSYDYYRDVIHEDNNKKGYPTEPRMDTSGYTFANHVVNGVPLVLNTGLSTGAFGCAGSSLYGAGMVQGGGLSGAQVGGALGYPSGSLDVNGILNGSLGGPGANANANGGFNVGGQANPAQLQAMIQQQNALAQQAQQRAQALSAQASYAQSVSALQADYRARIDALGPSPMTNYNSSGNGSLWGNGGGSWGGGTNGGFMQNGILQGGVNIEGYINSGSSFDVMGQGQGNYHTNGVPYQVNPTSFNPNVPNNQNNVPVPQGHQSGTPLGL